MEPTKRCPYCGEEILAVAIKCKHCGSDLSVALPAPQKPSRPAVRPVFQLLGAIVLAVVVIAIIEASKTSSPDNDNSGASTASGLATADSTPNASDEVIPPIEARFIQAVTKAQRESEAAQNDMQRGGIRAARETAICALLPMRSVSNWVGTVATVDSNSDGKGVLDIKLADHITVTTWNNALSDISDGTLIEPGTPLFAAASALRVGQRVSFSGSFTFGQDGTCIGEQSLTLLGKLSDPDFTFKFESVTTRVPGLNQATGPQTVSSEPRTEAGAADESSPVGSPADHSTPEGASDDAEASALGQERLGGREEPATAVPAPPERPSAPQAAVLPASDGDSSDGAHASSDTMPDDLAQVEAIDPRAAQRIATYCEGATANATDRAASDRACRQSEEDAWNRLEVEKEFPALDPAIVRECSQPPFPDSYEAREACAKYELHHN